MKRGASENLITQRLLLVTKVTSGIVVLIGGLVLVGWVLNIEPLIRLVPTGVVMNPVTALTFVMAGIALERLVAGDSATSNRRAGLWCSLAALVLLVGAFKLADDLFGLGFHIDHVLFSGRLNRSAGFPLSEMAPNTALNFFFFGAGLLLLDSKRRAGLRFAQGLVMGVGLISMLALIGYSYRVLRLYRVGGSIPMALDTALAFALLSVGFLAGRPERGLMPLITSQTTGGAMVRRLLPMAIVVPWLLGALLLMGEQKGFYRQEAAISIFAVTCIIIFTGLIWWHARLLYRTDLDRLRAEAKLRQTGANLERSNTELQQFAYVASHDLFEPLRTVNSYLQLLMQRCQGKLDKQSLEFIGFALDGAQRMEALIHDLLAYSRVDQRGRPFELVNCERVLRAALSNLKVAIEETGARITSGPLPQVRADIVQLTQVFQNLLGNAIKFHGPQPPRVNIHVEQRENEWLFSVHDNGIGIDPKYFERVFVIFQRLHTRQEYAGTGMGLAICKKIIERHGGKLWVESKVGDGATFYFTLPKPEE